MQELKAYSKFVIDWLSAHDIGPAELQLLSLSLAVLAIILTLLVSRRLRQLTSGVKLQHLSEKADRTSLQLGDLRKALESRYQLLEEELKTLRHKLSEMEREGFVAVSEEPKKKLPESSRPEAQLTPEPAATLDTSLPTERIPAPVLQSGETPRSIFSGLKKTRDAFFAKLSGVILKRSEIGPEFFEELEELLITSDLGVRTTQSLLAGLKEAVAGGELSKTEDCRAYLKNRILSILESGLPPEIEPNKQNGEPLVILVVGVNGVGKTTTIGKLASRFSSRGAKVLLGAADTFRAAAGEQIEVWAERANVDVLRAAENAKPSTVAYEAVHKGREQHSDVVIIDTAGRLHTRVNLMNELDSVVGIIAREQPGAPHEVLLVLDATTGQNALEQAKEFNARVKLSGIILTKLDGTPKGGILVAVRNELGVPIRYIGVGESAADLKPFSAAEFVDAMFAEGEGEGSFTAAQPKSAVRAVRRRGTDPASAELKN